mmetsp:Transcript_16675/g.52165  ORF Transcript_16675/g.52165 Transcript_16675/m.52165 type:complete len:197 (-) Transcript_16675:389-979(-)
MPAVWGGAGPQAPLVRDGPPDVSRPAWVDTLLSRGPPEMTLGARATVPAWSFGHRRAKENCPSVNSAISGVYVGESKRKHYFIWDGDDAPCQAYKMALVRWVNDLPSRHYSCCGAKSRTFSSRGRRVSTRPSSYHPAQSRLSGSFRDDVLVRGRVLQEQFRQAGEDLRRREGGRAQHYDGVLPHVQEGALRQSVFF